MTFKEDFKPTKVYNKLVNDVCYNADCLEEFEKQRLVVASPFSYNKSTRTGIVAEFDNGYRLSKENNKNDNEWNGNESNKDGSEDNDDKSDSGRDGDGYGEGEGEGDRDSSDGD